MKWKLLFYSRRDLSLVRLSLRNAHLNVDWMRGQGNAWLHTLYHSRNIHLSLLKPCSRAARSYWTNPGSSISHLRMTAQPNGYAESNGLLQPVRPNVNTNVRSSSCAYALISLTLIEENGRWAQCKVGDPLTCLAASFRTRALAVSAAHRMAMHSNTSPSAMEAGRIRYERSHESEGSSSARDRHREK